MDKIKFILDLLANCPPEDDEIANLIDDRRLSPWGFEVACGETRWAIFCNEWDFVLKIPRYGYASCDYCEKEMERYENARTYGVEKILLPIEVFCDTKGGIRIYKQPKYSFSVSEGSYNHKYDSYLSRRNLPKYGRDSLARKIADKCYCGYRLDAKWVARVLQLYGKKFCRSFEHWTCANEVNDLHGSNTGWLNNKPVIIDYAGFYE